MTAGVWPAARLSTMCALLSTLISHAKLRASQPQTAAAQKPQATSHDISASPRLQMTPTLEPLAPQHTHIHTYKMYCMWHSSPEPSQDIPYPIAIYSGTETLTHTHTHRDQAHSIPKLNSSHAYLWKGRVDPLQRISIEAVEQQIYPSSCFENEWNLEELNTNQMPNIS